MNSSITQNLNL